MAGQIKPSPFGREKWKGWHTHQNKRNKELRTHARTAFLTDDVKEKRNRVRLRDSLKVSLGQSITFFSLYFL